MINAGISVLGAVSISFVYAVWVGKLVPEEICTVPHRVSEEA